MATRSISTATALRMAGLTSSRSAMKSVLSRNMPRARKARRRAPWSRLASTTSCRSKQFAVNHREDSSMKQIARPATAAEIIEIVGPLDDAVLMRILETKATPTEVLEAFTWATADDQIGTELEHRPRGIVARVYDILSREEPAPDERG